MARSTLYRWMDDGVFEPGDFYVPDRAIMVAGVSQYIFRKTALASLGANTARVRELKRLGLFSDEQVEDYYLELSYGCPPIPSPPPGGATEKVRKPAAHVLTPEQEREYFGWSVITSTDPMLENIDALLDIEPFSSSDDPTSGPADPTA